MALSVAMADIEQPFVSAQALGTPVENLSGISQYFESCTQCRVSLNLSSDLGHFESVLLCVLN